MVLRLRFQTLRVENDTVRYYADRDYHCPPRVFYSEANLCSVVIQKPSIMDGHE